MTENKRLYYSIGEVAKMLNVEVPTIRYWEKEFKQIKPHVNKRGVRFFSPESLEKLKMIHFLIREKKYTTEGARQQLERNYDKTLQSFDITQKLKDIRRKLEQIKTQM